MAWSPALTGALKRVGPTGSHGDWVANESSSFDFNASWSNAIYSGSTIQIPSIQSLIIIKS